jgi:hypothetical protein
MFPSFWAHDLHDIRTLARQSGTQQYGSGRGDDRDSVALEKLQYHMLLGFDAGQEPVGRSKGTNNLDVLSSADHAPKWRAELLNIHSRRWHNEK